MNLPQPLIAVLLFAGLARLSADGIAADPPKDAKDDGQLVITDANGKEIILPQWKIAGGTRKPGWLTGKKADYFEMRESGSTTYQDGVMTFVPLQRIQSIKYDYDLQTASVQLAGMEKPLSGTTKFKDFNTIIIETELDQGKSGVAAQRYRGGVIKVGFKQVKFPDAKAPEPKPAMGKLFSFLVAPEGKGKPVVMTATNVQALYRLGDGTEKLLPWLMFKKSLKVEIGNIQKMHIGDYYPKEKTAECEVTLKDGMQLSLMVLSHATVDGKAATLVGLLGEVPFGWRLFPIHTFHNFQPGEMKIEEAKAPPAKKDETKKDEPKKDVPDKK
jgi:hypothetical protein